jgi:S1-C subfamily serine protease
MGSRVLASTTLVWLLFGCFLHWSNYRSANVDLPDHPELIVARVTATCDASFHALNLSDGRRGLSPDTTRAYSDTLRRECEIAFNEPGTVVAVPVSDALPPGSGVRIDSQIWLEMEHADSNEVWAFLTGLTLFAIAPITPFYKTSGDMIAQTTVTFRDADDRSAGQTFWYRDSIEFQMGLAKATSDGSNRADMRDASWRFAGRLMRRIQADASRNLPLLIEAASRRSPGAVERAGDPGPTGASISALDPFLAAVVTVRSLGRHGSGFRVGSEGDYLTNEHVVGGARFVSLVFRDGKVSRASVLRVDPVRDLALLRGPAGTPHLALGTTPPIGAEVWAIGASQDYEFSVSTGVVSAVREAAGPDGRRATYIQTDVAINRESSGGPLVSVDDGTVSGMNAWGMREGIEGLTSAIPAEALRAFLEGR